MPGMEAMSVVLKHAEPSGSLPSEMLDENPGGSELESSISLIPFQWYSDLELHRSH